MIIGKVIMPFNIGDKVKVIYKSYGQGDWNDHASDNMDDLIGSGRICTIVDVYDAYHVRIEVDDTRGRRWNIDSAVLELVTPNHLTEGTMVNIHAFERALAADMETDELGDDGRVL